MQTLATYPNALQPMDLCIDLLDNRTVRYVRMDGGWVVIADVATGVEYFEQRHPAHIELPLHRLVKN